MAERTFDYEKIAEIYKSMQEITGDAGSPESIAGLLELANKDMAEKCGVEDEAIFGPLADQLTMDWGNFSSNFPNFVANFNNWATVVSNASGQYSQFEEDVKGLKDANPLGYASEGRSMNYIDDSYYQKYSDENRAQFDEDYAALGAVMELTAADYTVSGASSRLKDHKFWAVAQIPFYAVGAVCTAIGAYALVSTAVGGGSAAAAGEGAAGAGEGAAAGEGVAAAGEGTAAAAGEGSTVAAEVVEQTGATVARSSVSTASQITLQDGTTFVQNSAGRWIDQATGRYVSNAAVEAARQTAATTAEQTVANATRLTLSNGTNIVQNSAGRWIVEAGQSGGGQFVSNAAVEEAKTIAYNEALGGLTGGTANAAASATTTAATTTATTAATTTATTATTTTATTTATTAATDAAATVTAETVTAAGEGASATATVTAEGAASAGESTASGGGSVLSRIAAHEKNLLTTALGKNPEASKLAVNVARGKLGMQAGGGVMAGSALYGIANKK